MSSTPSTVRGALPRFAHKLAATTALIAGMTLGTAPAVLAQAAPAAESTASRPWMDTRLSASERTALVLKEMTLPEKLTLVFGYFSTDNQWQKNAVKNYVYPEKGLPFSAGYVPGIDRLGVPAQWQTDAGIGVATQTSPTPRQRTALPSGIATAASWNPRNAFAGGAMIGNEAWLSGFNVQLAGGMNLMRDARNGRNFEYGGEDPLLAGVITGNAMKGIQSNNVITTMKHFAFNGQETNRFTIDHKISDQAGRQSDLLAFQIAYEIGDPGSIMCAYNRVNGFYACESNYLLNEVLKQDWGYKGYVMSDWGATHSTIPAANQGLDQQSGWAFDRSNYFEGALREAVNNGYVSQARIDDMAGRILWAMFDNGLFDNVVKGDQADKIDYTAHAKVTQTGAEEGIVLLKNTGVLPLAKTAKSIVVIGAHADVGVLSGGGSSQVYPIGLSPVKDEFGKGFPGPKTWYPSSPLKGIQARTKANVTYVDFSDQTGRTVDPASGRFSDTVDQGVVQAQIDAAAKAAATADVVVVFAEQWMGEAYDAPDLNLPHRQNDLIAAVAKANPKTVVVLQTGGPVVMPWVDNVAAVLEAWYPGTSGGEAIARVLTGEVNPSGHLPATFPASLDQTPRPIMEGDMKLDNDSHPHSDYNIDGAAVGYKWFDKKGYKPLFAFGHGLSYSTFQLSGLSAKPAGKSLTASFTIKNTGKMAGAEVGQVYVSPVSDAGWEAPKRLAGFEKISLKPGKSGKATVTVDPRLLATFDSASKTWNVKAGDYKVILATSATEPVSEVVVTLEAQTLNVKGQ
ncbi:beta-glucosidase [Asticcacaulis sp. AC402]|uniref:beta-glucosidase family protein n=1 Tax=Asticcacaulis sp. AC402 TaxID=1282361 RepID=UPI0003C3D97A|nr:glycoside hydrolase family 3 C-terminal domain-containing protein [Asticcacaulis sp. AC402]ESQ76178.1 beta-glucosidase [Asticcacaulis sp. AC402]